MSESSSDSQDQDFAKGATAAERLEDFQQRHAAQQRGFHGRSPKRIGNVIAQLVQRRGYAQVRAAGQREEAWREVLGDLDLESWAESTRVAGLKRGTLEIHVASSLLMQELTFCKEQLLASLQAALPEDGIEQIRFRVANLT